MISDFLWGYVCVLNYKLLYELVFINVNVINIVKQEKSHLPNFLDSIIKVEE